MNFANTLISALASEPRLAIMVSQPPIAFYRSFVEITGAAMPALMLSALLDLIENGAPSHPDGWFVYDPQSVRDYSGLTRHEQKAANKILLEKKLLCERKAANQWEMRLDFECIAQALITAARAMSARPKAANLLPH